MPAVELIIYDSAVDCLLAIVEYDTSRFARPETGGVHEIQYPGLKSAQRRSYVICPCRNREVTRCEVEAHASFI